MRRIIGSLGLLLTIWPCSVIGGDSIATIACDNLTQLQTDAAHDDPKAQLELAKLYFSGTCVPQDSTEGAKLLNRSATLGYAVAQGYLATTLHVAGADKDAARVALLSAHQGDSQGEFILSLLLERGSGITKDDTAAAKWARLSAIQGNAAGQMMLGNMYEQGKGGLERDLIEADRWYILSQRTSQLAHSGTNQWLRATRFALEGHMSKSEIDEANKRADAWKADSSTGPN